jgi:mono/diheme cytochrome c family protein
MALLGVVACITLPLSRMGARRGEMTRFLTTCIAALAAASAAAQDPVERGGYLVNAVMVCDGCHTPRVKGALDMSRRFSGGSQVWDTPAYTVRGTNITPDRETGIGAWTDAEIKRSLTDGVHRLGRPMSPQMPFPFYKILTPRDLEAIVAYLRSVPAVRNDVPSPVYKAPMHVEPVPNALKPYTDADLRDPARRGFYLATIAHCMECHARRPDEVKDYRNAWGKGGYVFKGPWGSAVVPNITSHPTSGIGSWTDEEIRRALTHGVSRDGRAFKLPMARQEHFSRMTEEDLNALVGWIRTIPPIE